MIMVVMAFAFTVHAFMPAFAVLVVAFAAFMIAFATFLIAAAFLGGSVGLEVLGIGGQPGVDGGVQALGYASERPSLRSLTLCASA